MPKLQLLTCIACFNLKTGDIEDAPALDPLAKYEILEKDGAVYIKGDEAVLKANRTKLNLKCSAQGVEKVVVVGGYDFLHHRLCAKSNTSS